MCVIGFERIFDRRDAPVMKLVPDDTSEHKRRRRIDYVVLLEN
jgi:hypothetical protein